MSGDDPRGASALLREHLLGRCGQVVTRLAEAGLVDWPVLPESEREIREWWLVSDELAARLRAAGLPVLRFGELNMWGRASTDRDLAEDFELIGLLPVQPQRSHRT
jgi:hypothetical protein